MKMYASTAINQFVEYALPRFSDPSKLFHIGLSATLSHYTDDAEREAHRDIRFLFQRPSNYTKVFVAVAGHEYRYPEDSNDRFTRREWMPLDDEQRVPNLNELKWFMTCDHDSCWRTDGVESTLNGIKNGMYIEVFGERIGDGHEYVSFNSFRGPEFVQAEVVTDEEANHLRPSSTDYMRKPINITEWPTED